MKATILSKTVLSHKWADYSEYKIEYIRKDGTKEIQLREIHDSGNGAAIILYNILQKTVLLVKQFRLATMLNGNSQGILLECCAGLVEDEVPEKAIIREVQEELGYTIHTPRFLFSAYATPGAKTEKIFFYLAPYDLEMKTSNGGGSNAEQEEVEVAEILFEQAIAMIQSGDIQDAKTIIILQQMQLLKIFD